MFMAAASIRAALLRRATRAVVAAPVSPASAALFSTSAVTRANDFKQPPPIHHPQAQGELAVGELEGAKFRVEPLRRVGEDDKTMRARLVCTFSLSPTVVYPAPAVPAAVTRLYTS
jgi:hypothetical protein